MGEDDDSQIAQSFAGSEGMPEGSRGKGSFELPKRCERCKRAKKGAQYCFDAGHHLNPGDPRPVKAKRTQPPTSGNSTATPKKVKLTASPPLTASAVQSMDIAEQALEPNQDLLEVSKTAGAGQGALAENDEGENGEMSNATFDPKKRPRHWARRAVPIQLIGGEEIHIMKWVTDTARKLSSKEESFTSAEAQEALKRKAALAQGRKLLDTTLLLGGWIDLLFKVYVLLAELCEVLLRELEVEAAHACSHR
uniref:Uncharacterized protein n=1 Tax=Guillardia theta TaxID=55529 RepID=A0A7S4PI88_GUITH